MKAHNKYYVVIYLPLESEGQSNDSLSGAIIGGIIGGAIGVVALILNIVILFIWTMWCREHSKHTKGVHSNLLFAQF